MNLVNKNLITLSWVLFCFLSGIGCIFPFLPMHMLAVGLNRGEARLISAVAPCVAILGPAVLGCLIDKLSVGRGSTGGAQGPSGSGRLLRFVTAVCLILSALFYTLLLAVPYTERHEARRPQVLFMCDEDSAYVMQEVCKEDMRCNRWSGVKSGVLAVGSCEYGCADENMTWVRLPFVTASTTTTISLKYNSVANSTAPTVNFTSYDEDEDDFEVHPPHLCYDGECQVYMQHANRMRVPLSLVAPEPPEDNSTADSAWCTYRTNGPQCIVPLDRLPPEAAEGNCKPAVRCKVLDPYDEPDGVLADAECRLQVGDPTYTFTVYLIIRILADIWPTAALALLGAACVIATRETSLGRGDVGKLLAVGTLGLALFPPLAGLAAEQMPETQYVVPFVFHAVFMLIGALILLVDSHMPLSTPEWWWHTSTGVLAMPMNTVRRYGAETAAVFAVVALLGTLWSGIDAYLPWTMMDLNGTIFKVGLTLTAGALPALPALWWAEALVDFVGHSNVFITAFTFYCLRYTGLAYSTNYYWIVACEVLEVFTMSLVWVTAVLYFRHLVPRKYTTTGQALPVIAHFCIGRCIGVRPVIMSILKNTPHIDDKYLKVLVRDRELYNDTDTEVKRQIWQDNQSLFGDEVSPLLSQYIREKENILFDHENLTNLFFSPSPKVRRQGAVVQKLAHMIGNSVKLYDMVLQFLRTLFLRTRNVHYCTLRAELLMALHDLEIQDIISVDPCHKFTWCLDACIRERNVDIKRSRELQGFLDSIKRGQEQVLGDLSMTLCDPYAINFLATSAIKILQHLINTEGLPRDNTILILLLRMLALGLSAWVMIDSQEFKEPKLDSQVVTKYLPALMSLMVDDQVRALHNKLPPDERESAITTIEHSGPAPDACEAYMRESSVCGVLAMYYTLHAAKLRDRGALLRILSILGSCKDGRAYEDPFLHALVALLVQLPDEFQGEDFSTVLFDEFFFAGLSKDNVTRHLLKLLWYIYPKLPETRIQTLMKALQPGTQHNESVHKLHEALQQKLTAQIEPVPTTSEMEYLDSPLMSVPTPAPYHM